MTLGSIKPRSLQLVTAASTHYTISGTGSSPNRAHYNITTLYYLDMTVIKWGRAMPHVVLCWLVTA
jgi:hypothetical protein